METRTRRLDYILYLSFALLLTAGTATVVADDGQEMRVTTTSQGQGIRRGGVGDGALSHDELAPLRVTGTRENSTRASKQISATGKSGKPGSSEQNAVANVDFWIYSADVQLYGDLDRDGYWSGIDLAFDADTVFTAADVYAVVYLSYNLGPWNEYAETQNFTIFGASSADEYAIETDLVSGYLTGDYDILIELFDANDDAFVASFGPEDSSKLSLLPLEDIGRDTPPGTVIVVNDEGGGSLGWFGLIALLGVAGRRTLLNRLRFS